jgi:flagellar hook-associated protein 2
MGTVGLSFGSPTSGQGFDVSSTVASIVGNLQNVETPWKTQLTSLESQDTVISNLGTLFSNLSNDLSSLTDLQGILAQKTGSSSDTNVLELTSASSSATAGTHTVVVNSLAATSSGYLAEVSDSSATLSGQITLQMGNGTAETFAIGAQPSSGAAANTTYTGSGGDTLADLASTINSSGLGVTANVESDSSGTWLSLTSGTSGANGNITVSGNKLGATGKILGYTGTAGTDASGSIAATASTGTLPSVGSGDSLSGSISIQAGSGSAISIAMSQVKTATGGTTAGDLATYIQNNYSSTVTAAITTNSDGSVSLSLTSPTAGSAGSLTVDSSLTDTSSSALGYTKAVTGVDANLTIDGKSNIHSSSNTVSNLIPGLTFQLLSASSTAVQIVIGNDNSDIESTVNQFVTDYNSLISAVNTQEGNTSSGTPEPLFGSPTLTLLQQQLLSGLNMQNPSGYVNSISSTNGTTLADQSKFTIQMGDGSSATFIVGSGSDTASPGTYYTDNTDTGGTNNGNTLAGLAATINAASGNTILGYSGVAGTTSITSNGTLDGIADESDTLSGSISIQVGSGTAQTITLDSSDDTLTGLRDAINNADLGVTASIAKNGATGLYSLSLESGTSGTGGTLTVTSSIVDTNRVGVTAGVKTASGESTLTLASWTAGSSGALTVNSALTANTPTALSYTDTTPYTSTTADSGTLTTIENSGDTLGGSISIQVGSGNTKTINIDSSNNTLTGLMGAINNAGLGVTASLNNASTALTLTSGTVGSTGALTVTSNLYDASDVGSTAALGYNASSDIGSLSTLGITVNSSGTLSFDASSLDSVLNTDFSSVAGFFQNTDSWGQTFSNMLTNSGTSSSTGILKLAQNSNSSVESTLNADISREEALISAEQKSLTAELNSANEILQQLPTELSGINEMYAAITGYGQSSNG